ncbi:MAG: hypothetical protein SPJ23_02330 [Eubacteriales bacterium]|nr:hypothetical protein [Eubacteriales bacterium]
MAKEILKDCQPDGPQPIRLICSFFVFRFFLFQNLCAKQWQQLSWIPFKKYLAKEILKDCQPDGGPTHPADLLLLIGIAPRFI